LKLRPIRRGILLGLHGAAALAISQDVLAQATVTDADVQSVRVVGSRRVGNTSATDTTVPVDTIQMSKVADQGGQFDLAQASIPPPCAAWARTRRWSW
jgi:iron complex outermembrane receptor protein